MHRNAGQTIAIFLDRDWKKYDQLTSEPRAFAVCPLQNVLLEPWQPLGNHEKPWDFSVLVALHIG